MLRQVEANARSIVTRFGAVLFNFTERCNLRCRHCGFGGAARRAEMAAADLRNWAAQAVDAGISRVTFTGGEPFSRFALLKIGAETVRASGGTFGVFSSAWWGESVAAALRKIGELPGLSTLYLSSDYYHWEYVPPDRVLNVIRAALEIGVGSIIICITYADEEEREAVTARFAQVANQVRFYYSRVIRSDFVARRVPRAGTKVDMLQSGNFSASCFLHTPLVNPTGTVTMCHIGKEETHGNYETSPYILGNLHGESLTEIFRRAEKNPLYNYLWVRGPRGVAEAALASREGRELAREAFTSDCEMCCRILPRPAVLEEIRRRSLLIHELGEEMVAKAPTASR